MLKKLNFKVTFERTGKSFEGRHEFETGMTSITGKNEAGKSLRLEMIRYALFGTKALRSDSKSYQSLEAKLQFVVHGKTYEVQRKASKASLVQHAQPDNIDIATATKPVNEAIIRILGYDLEVFDIANNCGQGEIEALASKTPAERKRMVDRTIGLDAVDRVLKKINEEHGATRKAIEMMNSMVLEKHEAPEPVIGNLSEVEATIADIQKKLQEKMFLEGQLFSAQAPQPEPLGYDLTDEILESLEDLQAQAQAVELNFNNLKVVEAKLNAYKKAHTLLKGRSIQQLADYIIGNYEQQWKEYNAYEDQRASEPTLTQETIDFVRQGLKIEALEASKIKAHCPKCEHDFLVSGQGTAQELANFDRAAFHAIGIKDEKVLRNAEADLDRWQKFKALPVVTQPQVEREPETNAGLQVIIDMNKEFVGYDWWTQEQLLDQGQQTYATDKDKFIRLIMKKKQQVFAKESLARQVEAYNKYLGVIAELQPKLDLLQGIESNMTELKALHLALTMYERAKAIYETKQEAQAEALESMKDLDEQLDRLNKVRKSLTELKPKVKVHLLPSLNSVASRLLAQMTNNERNQIVIDEDFEIKVDGQLMNELSGSAKAVANLAVRIGLGMVLTNKVFSVLLADEIDAAMDDERAMYTAQCLRNLSESITQIVLVSHKQPDADHQIVLT